MKHVPAILHILIPGCIVILFTASAAHSISIHSRTVDEGYHVIDGMMVLRMYDLRLSTDHPYFGHIIVAAPIAAFSDTTYLEKDNTGWQDADADRVVKDTISINGGNYQFTLRILSLARAAVLVLAIASIWLFYIFAQKQFGTSMALYSTLLLSLSPTIIAHSTIATNDIVITILIFLTTALLFLRGKANAPSVRRIYLVCFLIAGFLALITKQSALVAAIGWIIVIAIQERKHPLKASMIIAGVIATWIFLIWASFGFYFSYYLSGIQAIIIGKYKTRHESFFFGAYENLGWYYHPVAFLIKEPIPFVLLALAGIGFSLQKARRYISYAPLILIPLIFGIIASASHTKIGIRHVLPVYPFLALYGGYGATQILKKWPKGGRNILIAAMVYLVFSVTVISPHHLTYFNEFVGGAAKGYRYLQDSNLDWDQNEMMVQEYIEQHLDMHILYEPGDVVPGHYYIIRLSRVFGKASDQSRIGKIFQTLYVENKLEKIDTIGNTHWLVWLP